MIVHIRNVHVFILSIFTNFNLDHSDVFILDTAFTNTPFFIMQLLILYKSFAFTLKKLAEADDILPEQDSNTRNVLDLWS
jgi:hypothetical protein